MTLFEVGTLLDVDSFITLFDVGHITLLLNLGIIITILYLCEFISADWEALKEQQGSSQQREAFLRIHDERRTDCGRRNLKPGIKSGPSVVQSEGKDNRCW